MLYSSLISDHDYAFKLRILISGFLRICMKYSKNIIQNELIDTTNEEFINILILIHSKYEPKEQSIQQQIKSFSGSLKPIYKHYKLDNFDSYLDFGCGSGIITMATKEIIHSIVTHGIDITNNLKVELPLFELDNIVEKYDFITINHVLHHVADLSILSKLVSLLNNNGYILLKEHDCNNDEIKTLMILQHEFYSIDKFENMPVIHFKNKEYWIELFESHGLVNQGIYINNYNDATNSFYVLFKRIK